MKILIIKTSALGDVLQAFDVLCYLRTHFPEAQIHWVIEEKLQALVLSHPWIDKGVVINKEKKSSFWSIRKERYDVVFDLQGNTKSALLTFLAKAKQKVGFGKKTVKEFPSLLVTRKKINPPSTLNIREQYIYLVASYFKLQASSGAKTPLLQVSCAEKAQVEAILAGCPSSQKRLLVAPWSNWENKELSFFSLLQFLQKVQKNYDPFFLLVWGNPSEKEKALELQKKLKSLVLPKLSFPALQYLMQKVEGLLACDSSLLHLAGNSQLASFSFFGPTHPHIFKPQEKIHAHYFGPCPYKVTFPKQCPHLRTCSTGACLKYSTPEILFKSFKKWGDLFLKDNKNLVLK